MMFKACKIWLSAALLMVLMFFGASVAVAAVTSISPTSANEGGASFTLTVNGSSFTSTSQVAWTPTGGTATQLSRLSQSTSRLTATVPASLIAEEGTAGVTVTGPGAGGPLTFTVNDVQLTGLVDANLPATGVEGTVIGPITSIAIFTDPGGVGSEPLTDFTATVNWGDSTTSSGTVVSLGGGSYRVDAPAHTYVDEGIFTENVTLKHDALAAVTTPGQIITVADADVVTANSGVSITPTEGTAYSGPIATFNDTYLGATASDFKLTSINWGDGTTDTNGTVGFTSGLITVNGTHTYTDEGPATTVRASTTTTVPASGTYTIPVINSGTANFPSAGTITVITSSGPATVTYTGKTTGTNATTFTGCSGGTAGSTISGGTVISQQGYVVVVTLAPADLQDTWAPVTASSTAAVADADVLTLKLYPAGPIGWSEGKAPSSNPSASFTDSYTGASGADFSATIDWGDGSPLTTSSSVSGSAGSYTINWPGFHTYAHAGLYTYTVRVYEDNVGGALLATGTNTVTVGDAPSVGYYQTNTTIASTSNGAVLPTATINVAYGFNFPTSGSLVVVSSNGPQVVDYTGRTGSTFTGCTGGTGKLSTGGAVTATFKTIEGSSSGTVTVGHWVEGDSNTYLPNAAGDWTATIHWGDNTTSTGTVTQVPGTTTPPQFYVSGSHTYAEEGTYSVSYDAVDYAGLTLLSSTTINQALTATVADLQLTSLASANLPASGVEGSAIGPVTSIATFSDPAGPELIGDYAATVNWGDSTTSAGTIVSLGGGNYEVDAPDHTYAEEGTYTVNVTLTHDLLAPLTTPSQTIVVTDAQLTSLASANLPATGVEGSPIGAVTSIATFSDPAGIGLETLADYSATVNWGDASTSAATVVSLGGGNYEVDAPDHTYAEEGTYTVNVTLTHDLLAPLTTPDQTIAVADPAVSLTGVAPLTTAYGTALGTHDLAAFIDPAGPEANDGTHYSAAIDWGGSFGVSLGSISFSAGTFTVSGAIPYTDPGSYTPTVTVTHENSQIQVVTDAVTVNPIIVPTAGPGGSISPNTTQTVVYGSDSATFTITPNTGYRIADVLVDGVSHGPITSYKFTGVTANHTIAANFAINTYTLSYSAATGGSIAGSSTQVVNYNASGTTVTATPSTGSS